ncbi:transporter substrate-binding domain-containing protein [Rhizobium sp. AG855]|uniref:substrate-binding periplasmic protein n=1 Tax=Rhizobium sp. AG855 TaxID=2183898 RepID=UPI000E72F05B|nr:transporter substrate-binding domain-containing protein [Rhizobium sp. AG855]RKE84170.1 amino acid ABC transporter substrate-binding protein (PAAT family) [Rhizobium sp. AG855]
MKMLAVLLSLVAAPVAAAEAVHFTTEDYPPYNFREGDQIKGAGYDQILLMMKQIGVPYSIDMMPWARAIALAETTPLHCVFTTAHIPERDGRFVWIEPLAIGRNLMIGRKGGGVDVKNVEEAKAYTVGTQRDDYTETLLEELGFAKIDLASDIKLNLKKLQSGRIDLMPLDEQHYVVLEKAGEPIEFKFIFTEQKFSLACHPDFPEDLRLRMQAALDALIADGTQAKILASYGLDKAKLPEQATKP